MKFLGLFLDAVFEQAEGGGVLRLFQLVGEGVGEADARESNPGVEAEVILAEFDDVAQFGAAAGEHESGTVLEHLYAAGAFQLFFHFVYCRVFFQHETVRVAE